MERFDEPKPDLKVRDETTTLKSESPVSGEPVASRLVTEPAQLALTRADRLPAAPKKADEGFTWDAVSDWFGLGQPLMVLILLLSIPWILSSPFVQGPNAGFFEHLRTYVEAYRAETTNNYSDAIGWIKQEISTLPPLVDGKPINSYTAGRYVYLYTRIGGLNSKMGDFSSARTYYGKAVALIPFLSDHEWDAWRHLHYGWALRRDGRSDLAIKELEQATKEEKLSSGNRSFAWRELAMSYNNVGRYEDGLAAAKRSTEKSSENDIVWDSARRDIICGDAYEGLNRHEDALKMYKAGPDTNVDQASKYAGDYMRAAGIFYEESGDQRLQATRSLEDALVKLRVPDSGIFDASTVLNDLAHNAMLTNDLPRAAGYLEQAKMFDSKKSDKENNLDYARDLYNMAKVKLAMNDSSAAKANLRQCFEIRKKLLGESNVLTKQAEKLLSTM